MKPTTNQYVNAAMNANQPKKKPKRNTDMALPQYSTKAIALICFISIASLAKGNDSTAGAHLRKAITHKVVSLTAGVCSGLAFSMRNTNTNQIGILFAVGAVASNIAMWCELWLAAKDLEHENISTQ